MICLGLLLCLGARAGDIVLKNRHAELCFDDGKQFIFRHFRMNGKELLPESGSTVHPWEVNLLGPLGETPALQPRWAWYDGGRLEGDTAVFTWRLYLAGKSDWPLRMKVQLGADDELPRWSVEATLPEGHPARRLRNGVQPGRHAPLRLSFLHRLDAARAAA